MDEHWSGTGIRREYEDGRSESLPVWTALYRLNQCTGESDGNMCQTKGSDPVATTDEEALAGDPPRLLGGEEDDYVGHVVGPPHAPKWDVRHNRLLRVRGDPPGLDRARGHHVDGDPILTELHGG